MSTARYVHWQDGGMWLGYFVESPDYLTQGETLPELEENLRDLYRDLTSGEIPGIRRVAELSVGTYHGSSLWWDVSHGKIIRAIDVGYMLPISPDGTRIVTSNGELRDASAGSLIRPLTSGTFETRLYVAAFLQIAERSMGGI